MSYRIGVDIGGTFTDFGLFDEAGGRLAVHKQLTTPHDPSHAVLEGVATMLREHAIPVAEVTGLAHGTTLVTNAVIERRGAVTGMLVTEGFRDLLDMAMETRYDLFDLRLTFPEPLVPRSHRREIPERVTFEGKVAQPLALEVARNAVTELVTQHDITALAVCFLHAYVNDAHERAVLEMLRAEFPDLYVSGSAEIYQGMREYERWTTTTMNAFVQPMFDRYLERLEHGLRALGFRGTLSVMSSSGGVLTPELARRFPVRVLESGPAAGVLMSALHGKALDLPNVLSFDMGGTTAKGALIRDHAPLKADRMEVARMHDFKRGSGLPARIPVIDMIEIGSGGGSIALPDARGLLKVGPRSAGADPGPACYDRGGTAATLTDANLTLGYLNPDFFLGGRMSLDSRKAEAALADNVANRLDLDVMRAAWGVHEIANEDVARAFRIHASERGFDYRGATMVAFGGSGPLHALAIAAKLKIPRVVFPIGAGVMSALGLLASPLAFEFARTRPTVLEDIDPPRFAAMLEPMLQEARQTLVTAGAPADEITVSVTLEMRYYGQGYEIGVDLPDGLPSEDLFAGIPALFAARYTALFGVAPLNEPLEIVHWKVAARGPDPSLRPGYRLVGGDADGSGQKGSRRAYFGDLGVVDTPVYDRYALRAGETFAGPALVEERESTCVVPPGCRFQVDAARNLIAEIVS